MTGLCEKTEVGPSSFAEALDFEWHRIRNGMMTYIFRYHLSRYPKDLVRYWWTKERSMPWPTCQRAFEHYKAGKKPGHLFKGPLHWPMLKVISGGKRV